MKKIRYSKFIEKIYIFIFKNKKINCKIIKFSLKYFKY